MHEKISCSYSHMVGLVLINCKVLIIANCESVARSQILKLQIIVHRHPVAACVNNYYKRNYFSKPKPVLR